MKNSDSEFNNSAQPPFSSDATLPDVEASAPIPTESSSEAIDTAPKAAKRDVEKSAAGATWTALIIGALLLILLLVFILQNQEPAELKLFNLQMTFPIGVGMLIAAIIGALIMAIVGGVRMLQLRKQVRKGSA